MLEWANASSWRRHNPWFIPNASGTHVGWRWHRMQCICATGVQLSQSKEWRPRKHEVGVCRISCLCTYLIALRMCELIAFPWMRHVMEWRIHLHRLIDYSIKTSDPNFNHQVAVLFYHIPLAKHNEILRHEWNLNHSTMVQLSWIN